MTRNPHRGGQQLPLITPDTFWAPPSSLPDLRSLPRLAVDVETRDDALAGGRGPGWAYGAGYICGVGVAWDEGNTIRKIYVPTRHPEDNYHEPENVRVWLEDIIHSTQSVVFQNGGYDIGWLQQDWKIKPPAHVDDTIAAAVMVDEDRLSYSLDSLAKWKGIPGKDESLLREAAAAFGVDPKGGLYQLPARFVGPYGEADPAVTLALLDRLIPTIQEEETFEAYRLECDLIPMVHVMRARGIRIDTEGAERAAAALDKQRDDVLTELARQLGRTSVTISDCRSAKTLEGWFDAAGISYPRTEKTRQGSFQAKWMRKHEHWLPRLVSRAEQLTEASDKFLRGFILNYAHKGRLHANINQFRSDEGGTRTHRFSYSDPPLQQMPFRDPEIAEIIRGCFLPEENEFWLSADFKQQEYRLIVHYAAAMGLSGAAAAAERYQNDPETDFHFYVAELTGLDRKPAKDANFAKAYGAGAKRVAEMTERTVNEAQEIIDVYDRELPFVRALNERCAALGQRRGWVRLLDGARCHFNRWEPNWDWRKEHSYVAPMPEGQAKLWCDNQEAMKGRRPVMVRAFTKDAMNKIIQGGAARQTKLAMRECWQNGLLPMLQMHDELDFSVSAESQGLKVKEIMKGVKSDVLLVPMDVDLEYGRTWGDAAVSKHGWEDLTR